MKKIIILLLLCISVSVHSAETKIDVSDMTPQQKKELITKLSEPSVVDKTVEVSQAARSEAAEWGQLGSNLGHATVAAAKEVGIAASDFAQTPLGHIIMFIMIYKLLGHAIILSILSFTLMCISIYFITSKKYCSVEYENHPVLFKLWNKKIVKNYKIDGDIIVGYWVSAGLSMLLSIIIGCNV